ncbi:MAG: ferritin-like protein [Planctomycetaceae bacterium]|nr:ferritin-like protein [Planctomycetaceae bacterium]MCB9949354.1 ferritin-like protein [Planctomycetaceae bacterium]
MKSSSQIRTREELIYALCRAAEIEHGLTCIYLFAAFSMKRFLSEGIDEVQQDQVRNWEAVVLAVAKQEMEHLGIVCNLLNSIGAPQHFSRPNLPQPAEYYQTEFPFSLEPFSLATIQMFMEFEKPATNDFAEGEVEGDGLVPDPIRTQNFHTVQELYATVLEGFEYLDTQGDLFIGPPEAQINDGEIVVGFNNREYGITMIEVTDLQTAKQAVDIIIEQGEGIPIEAVLSTKHARELQRLYGRVVENLQVMKGLTFDVENWRQSAELLCVALSKQHELLVEARELLKDDEQLLNEVYWYLPHTVVELIDMAIAELSALHGKAEAILHADNPDSPVGELEGIQSAVMRVTQYDVEGVLLSGFTNPESHYIKFWSIYEQLKTIDYQPARNVVSNPALRLHADNKEWADQVTIAENPYSRNVMELLNASYETMVQMLLLTFSYNNMSNDARYLFTRTAFFPFMSMVIRPLCEMLTLLPVGGYDDDRRTGPPFEYYIDIALLPNFNAGMKYLNERLVQIAKFSDPLVTVPEELRGYLGEEQFTYLREEMTYLNGTLHRIQQNFAAGPVPSDLQS